MSQSPISGAVRLYLRDFTAPLHAQLDSAFSRFDLQNRPGYGRFLSAQAVVIIPLEEWLTSAGISHLLPDWPDRRRAAALAEDLSSLSQGAGIHSLRMENTSSAYLMGVTYVLEGSRLGARYLLKAIAASQDRAVRDNTRFLAHGQDKKLWPTFLTALETAVIPATRDEAARGARDTFALFLDAQRSFTPELIQA